MKRPTPPPSGSPAPRVDDVLGPVPRSSPLLRNLVLFGRLLRALGLPASSDRLIELLRALAVVDIRRREDFQNAARSILVSRHEDVPLFDDAFRVFWRYWSQPRAGDPLQRMLQELARQVPVDQELARRWGTQPPGRPERRARSELGVARAEEAPEEGREAIIAIYSPGEVLREKDFAALDLEELAAARRCLAEMRWTIMRRRSRRLRPARTGERLDVRRSMRHSLRHGGELLDLSYRGRKLKRRPLVVLCDISGSMDRYTRLLLHFLHSVESSVQRSEVFLFGTRLTRITRQLQRRDPDAAIAAVSSEVHDWAGGTRIGESLHTFNQRWARRVLGHGAIVLIISDGWDRGDPRLLAAEMERLQRHSYRLIWLNPLLGADNYQPLTQGIQAALPYIDDFLPVHNLASLEALGRLLNGLQEGRPDRKQAHRYES